ncbi:MAG: hypothetical protein AABZ06_08755, partial [Bdellovibrionota bacterium]
VPFLIEWISKVASGILSGDPAGADRQNEAWQKIHSLQSAERLAEGVIAFTDRLLQAQPPSSSITAANAQELTMRKAIVQLIEVMLIGQLKKGGNYIGGTATPISEYHTTDTALLYKLVGLPMNCVPQNCENVDTIPLPPGGFATITENARAVFKDIAERVLTNLHLVIDVDPSGLIKEAMQSSRVGRRSPLAVANDLITFLDRSADYFNQFDTTEARQTVALIRDTQAILADMSSAVLTADGTADGDRVVVKILFQRLNLIYGTDFIAGRIYRHIRWDLNSRIEHGQVPGDLDEILRASGRDAARELTGVSRSGLDELLQDINAAQAISQQNVGSFVHLFGHAFNGALGRLSKAADLAREPLSGPNRPNRMFQARICVLILTTSPRWPSNVDKELCAHSVIESIYPSFTDKLEFDRMFEDLEGQPLEKRMCVYKNFLRRSRLFGT